MAKCSVVGCQNKHKAKGFCAKHYYQWRMHGKILEVSKFSPNNVYEDTDHFRIELRDRKYNIVGHALVDKEDIEKCLAYKWCLNACGYVVARVNGVLSYLHRHILGYPGTVIDHKDRNKLNCKKENLRNCTQQQNTFNSSTSKNNTSGHTGVYRVKNKWYAQIGIKEEGVLSSPRYNTKEEAVLWRNKMEEKYHGVFKHDIVENSKQPASKRRINF